MLFVKATVLVGLWLLQTGLSFDTGQRGSHFGDPECCHVEGLTLGQILAKFKGNGRGNPGRGFGGQPAHPGVSFDYPGYGWGGWYKTMYRGGANFARNSQGQSEQFGQETQVKEFGVGQLGGQSNNQRGGGGGQESGQSGVTCCQNSRRDIGRPGFGEGYGK